MSPCHPGEEYSTQGFSMTDKSLLDVGEVPRHRPDHPDMFSRVNMGDDSVTNVNRRYQLSVFNIVSIFLREDQELRFRGRKLDLVLLAVVQGQLEKMLEDMNVLRDKGSIISEADSSNSNPEVAEGGGKARVLGRCNLLIVVNFIKIRAVGPSLLYATLVLDWPHKLVTPLTESCSS